MNFRELSQQLIKAVREHTGILIYIKGSPDPDVIASSFALKLVCDHFGVTADIFASMEISLPQNQAIVDDLKIPVTFLKTSPPVDEYDAYAILDYQSAAIKDVTGRLPCAVHIDHHSKTREDIPIEFDLVTESAGSTSTLMALMLKELDLPLPGALVKQLATALFFGIQTDTNNLRYAGRLDYEALQYSYLFADLNIINKISDLPLTEELITLIARAMINLEKYKDWLIAGIGFIDESQRDNIALVADFLLQREDAETVVVFAVIERNNRKSLTLDASFRTRNKNLNLNDLIKEISTEGGARKYKGAYQVNLDYFSGYPDHKLLWEVVRTTTVEVIKKNRDLAPFMGLRGFYRRIKDKAMKLFRRPPS